VFSRYRSYHGSSFGAGNLTGEPRRYPLEPGIPGFIKFFDPYIYREPLDFASEEEATRYYLAKLREQVIYEGADRIAAIEVETITGSNGIIIPPKGYLPGIRKICDEFGIVMICDEVMAGFGRTGKMFAFENFDVVPDIITFAKGVTCGYIQLGGVAVSKKIAAYFDDHYLSCGLTYSAHPLACAAGVACVVELFDTITLANIHTQLYQRSHSLFADVPIRFTTVICYLDSHSTHIISTVGTAPRPVLFVHHYAYLAVAVDTVITAAATSLYRRTAVCQRCITCHVMNSYLVDFVISYIVMICLARPLPRSQL
jgi:adenosylmethionine-8-amino-7-oxononanoate aminotransferase